MDGYVKFKMGKDLSWEEQDKYLSKIEDNKEFILALLENNPNVQYDIFSKRYSLHEDNLGYIENKLIERFCKGE